MSKKDDDKDLEKKDAPLEETSKPKKAAADLDAADKDDAVENEYAAEKQKEMDEAGPDDLVTVFISSKDTVTEHIDGQHYVTGSVNAEPFKVLVDQQVRIKRKFAEVLQPLIQKQRNGGQASHVNSIGTLNQ